MKEITVVRIFIFKTTQFDISSDLKPDIFKTCTHSINKNLIPGI